MTGGSGKNRVSPPDERQHEADFFKLAENEQQAMPSLIRSVRRSLNRKHSSDIHNISLNIGKADGQTVEHVHLDIIPRFAGDLLDP